MMHAGEVHADTAVVQRLLAEQFPALKGLPIRQVQSTGTVNAIYRIGDALYARLPRLAAWASSLRHEGRWLSWLAERLSIAIPEPVSHGAPSREYPLPWAIYRWIEGDPFSDDNIDDEAQAARDLAQFVLELRRLDPSGVPAAGRKPLRQLDIETRRAIEAARTAIDADGAVSAWEGALDAAAWNGDGVWIHADLLRPNLLVRSGRISAIIDFGSAGVGDPAADVIAAWSVFGPRGRSVFRSVLNVDDDTWRRARGFALHQAVCIIPYYGETNPDFSALARRTVEQVLLDVRPTGTLA